MEYYVVVRLSIKQLIEEVNDLIKEGWTPFGSLAVDGSESSVEYLQPMVKYNIPPSGGFDPFETP